MHRGHFRRSGRSGSRFFRLMRWRLAKKLRKMQMGANERDESKWPKCVMWIPNRSRFCSGERVPGSKYCVNHIHLDTAGTDSTNAASRRRVVCPVDPSHTVFEDRLEKHIKVCNKSKQKEMQSSCPYFVPNFNQGTQGTPKALEFDSPETVGLEWRRRV